MASQDTQNSLLNSVVQQEIAQRRQRVGIQRQDTRLSVKSLIESIEKSSHVKASSSDGISGSHCSSSSSINSMMSDVPMSTRHPITEWSESNDQSSQVKTCFCLSCVSIQSTRSVLPTFARHTNFIYQFNSYSIFHLIFVLRIPSDAHIISEQKSASGKTGTKLQL